jgi:hypothetical protein
MKKIVYIALIPLLFSLNACKKSYECTCTTSAPITSYSVIMPEYAAVVDVFNTAEEEAQNDGNSVVTTTVNTMEKTNKVSANAICSSSSKTESYVYADENDLDDNGVKTEEAYSETVVTTTDCSSTKKK